MADKFNMSDKANIEYTDVSSYGPLQNSWVDYGGAYALAGWTKDAQGVVYLKGLIKDGIETSGTLIYKLPVGYRPSEVRLFFVACYDTQLRHGRIDIEPDGDILARILVNGWVSLEGISFIAAPV